MSVKFNSHALLKIVYLILCNFAIHSAELCCENHL